MKLLSGLTILVGILVILVLVAGSVYLLVTIQGTYYDECNQTVKPDFPLECNNLVETK